MDVVQSEGREKTGVDETTVVTVEYYETLVTELVQTFISFLQVSQLYHSEEDRAKRITRNFRSILQDCLAWRNPFSLSLLQEQLFFEELKIDSKISPVTDLIDMMLERMIRRITFHGSVEDKDIFALAEILNLDSSVVHDRGGPGIMLKEDLRVDRIEIFELEAIADKVIWEPGTWQATLARTGIDIEDITRIMKGSARDAGPEESGQKLPIMKREFFQLVEFLMNPEILSQMILDLALVQSGEEVRVDPSLILSIVTHAENLLLLRSNFPIEKIYENLSEACSLWDQPTRNLILAEALRLKAMGLYVPNLVVYRFTSEEWAAALCNLGMDPGKKDWMGRVLLKESQWGEIEPFLQALFDKWDLENDELLERIAYRARQFESYTDCIDILPYELNEVLHAGEQAIIKGDPARRVGMLKSQLKSHIEAGYTHTVLGLLRFEQNKDRVDAIADKYLKQVLQILNQDHQEAVAFLNRISGVLTERGDSSIDLLPAWFCGKGSKFISGFLDKTKNLQRPDNFQALSRFLPFLKLSGNEGIRKMLDACWFENIQTGISEMQKLAEPICEDILNVLEEYLTENHEHFSPKRFERGMNLFLTLSGESSVALIEKCSKSESEAIRMATLLCLARPDSPKFIIPILRNRIFSDEPDIPIDERIIAAYGLGVLKDEESIDSLYKIAKGGRIAGKPQPEQLRLAAMYAYAAIKVPSAQEVSKLYLKITGQQLAGYLPWKKKTKQEDRL